MTYDYPGDWPGHVERVVAQPAPPRHDQYRYEGIDPGREADRGSFKSVSSHQRRHDEINRELRRPDSDLGPTGPRQTRPQYAIRRLGATTSTVARTARTRDEHLRPGGGRVAASTLDPHKGPCWHGDVRVRRGQTG